MKIVSLVLAFVSLSAFGSVMDNDTRYKATSPVNMTVASSSLNFSGESTVESTRRPVTLGKTSLSLSGESIVEQPVAQTVPVTNPKIRVYTGLVQMYYDFPYVLPKNYETMSKEELAADALSQLRKSLEGLSSKGRSEFFDKVIKVFVKTP